jgi:hypothetical protein
MPSCTRPSWHCCLRASTVARTIGRVVKIVQRLSVSRKQRLVGVVLRIRRDANAPGYGPRRRAPRARSVVWQIG